ncbi:MAG: DUF4232 domain-containing protein [Chloroflexota bacterium]
MCTTRKALITGAVVIGGLAFGGLGPAAHAREAAPAPTGACVTAQLWMVPEGASAGAGHFGVMYRFYNHSTSTCTLYGYPGGMLLNDARQALPTHVHWGPGYLSGNRPKRLVNLQPGASAYFVLEWTHIPAPGQSCPTSRFLAITPPNTRKSLTIPATIDACGGNLTASPVEPSPFSGF